MNQTEGFESTIKQYSEPLYWHIRRMVVCHEDAQDLLQDTFSSVFLHLWQIRDPAKTKAWLYTIATNKANRFLRKKARDLRCEDVSEYLCDKIESSTNVDYEKAAAIDLHKAVLKLPKAQQIVFNLRFFDEMEYEEICRITGSSIDSLRVNYHIAKKKVTQYIYEEQL